MTINDFLGAYGTASIIAMALFGIDKMNALADASRVPERVLLVVCFLFGWPGGLLAMKLLRHKTQKESFHLKLGVVIIANLIMVGFIIYHAACDIRFL